MKLWLLLEIKSLRAEGISGHQALARALTERDVPMPGQGRVWTQTTVTRLVAWVGL